MRKIKRINLLNAYTEQTVASSYNSWRYSANMAIDGKLYTCSITDLAKNDKTKLWWSVKLRNSEKIARIDIFSRKEGFKSIKAGVGNKKPGMNYPLKSSIKICWKITSKG